MIVTINTDASFMQDSKCGAFAFWILCNSGVVQKAGKFKCIVSDSHHAEAMSICNAIHVLSKQKYVHRISKVIINTDSMNTINIVTGKHRTPALKSHRDSIETIRLLMMEICLSNGKSIRDTDKMFDFRHVKAHTGKKDGRSECNKWCDKEAYKLCKDLHREVQQGKVTLQA